MMKRIDEEDAIETVEKTEMETETEQRRMKPRKKGDKPLLKTVYVRCPVCGLAMENQARGIH